MKLRKVRQTVRMELEHAISKNWAANVKGIIKDRGVNNGLAKRVK